MEVIAVMVVMTSRVLPFRSTSNTFSRARYVYTTTRSHVVDVGFVVLGEILAYETVKRAHQESKQITESSA